MSKMKEVTISDFGQTVTGKTPSSKFPEDFGFNYLFITPSDNFDLKYISETERYLSETGLKKLRSKTLLPNSILVSCIGSAMGKVSMNKTTAITNQQINSIVPDTTFFDNEYIYYLLKNNYKLLRNAATGSTAVPILNKTDFDALKFKVHGNKSDQKKIVSILTALDAKIDLNNQISAELEQMAKTLYNYWFIQFDFPDLKGKPYKSSGGKMVYNKVLKREVPEGWAVENIGKYVKYNRGISYTSKTIDDLKGIPMINLKSFNLNGTYRVDGLKYYNGNYASVKALYQNDLLIAITDVTREAEIIGRAIFVPDLGDKIVCSCDVAQVVPDEDNLTSSYIKFLFNSDHYHNYIKYFASGTLVLHLDLNGVSWFTDSIPPIALQRRFDELVKNIESKIQSNIEQNKELSNLRDWLLPMLMNGQVTVRDNAESYESTTFHP